MISHDLRSALRSLRRRPTFTLLVVSILALGIGANTVVFSFSSATLLDPLPFEEPERLVFLWSSNPGQEAAREGVSHADFLDWRRLAEPWMEIAAFGSWRLTLTGVEEPERLSTVVVSSNFFDLLGIRPLRGRSFLEEEETEGRDRVVVMSHGLWQRRFGGDPDLVGRPLQLDREPYTVVGVMGEEVRFPTALVELWKPMALDADEEERDERWLQVIGRLRSGVSLDEARAAMSALAGNLAREHPDTNAGWTAGLAPVHEVMVEEVRPALILLQVIVALVLLIACINIANLLLARGRSRQREIATRMALGASRGRLLSQLLAEGLVLAVAGAAAGLALAVAGVRWIVGLFPDSTDATRFSEVTGHTFPRLAEVQVDGTVLAFTAALCLGTTLIFGAVTYLWVRHRDLQVSLKEGGITGSTFVGQRLPRLLVVAQVAFALVLLVSAGLLSRSLAALLEVDPGFEAERVLTLEMSLGEFRAGHQKIRIIDELLGEIAAIPGVETVGFSTAPPFAGDAWEVGFEVAGRVASPGDEPRALYHSISPGYFRSLGIPLLAGRVFGERDAPGRPPVVMVNESLVRRWWPGGQAVGEAVVYGGREHEVVGVVGDTRREGLDASASPEIYFPYTQSPPWFLRLTIQAAGEDPSALVPAVQRRIWSLVPDLPLRNVVPLEELVEASISQRRFQVLLADLFGILALVLAAAGIYGVISYFVAEHRHELGVRMAMGAGRRRILGLVVGRGLAMSLAGIVVGLVGAFFLTDTLSSLLFGVSATDPLTFAGIALLLLVVALLASYLPARRVLSLDPALVLRHD